MAEVNNNQQLVVDNDALVAAIQDLKQDRSDEKFNYVARLIQRGNFVCPARMVENTEAVEKEDGKVALENKRSFNMHVLKNKDGKKYMAVFTSRGEIDSEKNTGVISSERYLVMNVVMLMAAFNKPDCDLDGIVIDPFTNNFAVPKEMLARMADSEIYTPRPNEQVKVTIPGKYPDGFIDTIREKLDEYGRVDQLFVLILERANQAKSLLLIVDSSDDKDTLRETFQKLAEIAAPFTQGMHLMFVPYTDNFAQTVTNNRLPVYRK